ncbi:Integral membrane protein OS=Streptomyces alboniger OX=132473 GN=CP975_20440 PE=4 SV=1 [Streptomyces alboniger]
MNGLRGLNGRNFSTGDPGLDFVITFLQGRVQRARSGELDRGASAVEWVIISAVVVAIVGAVAAIINAALDKGATKVGECIEGADAGKTC